MFGRSRGRGLVFTVATGLTVLGLLVAGVVRDADLPASEVAVVATTTTTATTLAPTTTTESPTTTAAPTRVLGARQTRQATPRPARVAPRGPQPTGRIAIPRIGLDHATYEGIELAIIDHGPSHWTGAAMPGEVGNTVFPGHRVTHSRPFYNIDLIQLGDQVIFTNDSGRFTYQVAERFVVDDSEVWIANQTDTATFTIFACHPKHSARQRYVVKGNLVAAERTAPPSDAPPAEPYTPNETTTTQPRGGLFGL